MFTRDMTGRLQLVDMGSANGSWVNGNRLEKNSPLVLKNGDVIRFWSYLFEYIELETFTQLLLRE
jgi:pSer/pThr/pTyr-binding forkhead associated (FHA) protein